MVKEFGMGAVVGGGIETLPNSLRNGGKNAVREWVKSLLDEGQEEIVQGIVSRGINNLLYNDNKDLDSLISTKNKDAVINPSVMLQEGAMGAAVGGILGGAQIGTASAIKGIRKNMSAKQKNDTSVNDAVSTNEHFRIMQEYENTVDNKISVNTDSIKSMLSDLSMARKNFVEYARRYFPQSVLNVNTKKRIGISRNGIDKFLSGNISKEKFSTGYKIPELLSTAYKVGEAENLKPKSGIKEYEYYENNVLIDGVDYKAHIRVRNTDMGDKYYGHTVSKFVDEIKIEPLAWNSDANATVHSINASSSNNIISQDNKIVNEGVYKNKATEQQTTAPTTHEQTARNAVNGRNRPSTPTYERLEALTRNNEPISVEEVKKVTGFGEEGSKMVAELANSDGVTFSQAERTVKNAYMVGFTNVDGTKVNFETDTQIDAYTAGRKDRAMQDLAAKERAKKADSYNGSAVETEAAISPEEAHRYDIPEGSEIVNNIVVDEHSKRLKREDPRAYSNIIRMAKRLRMKVRFVKNLVDENGNVLEGLITSKGIFISADAKKPSRFVATHEFGHRMKQAAPKVWAVYQEYVINKLKRERFGNGRTAYDVLYEETKNAYGKDDADSINEEIAVNYAGELFDSEEMLESFIREDKSLAHKVRDWWYNVLESLGLLSEKKKAQQLWLRAYTAASKNVKEGKVGEFSGEKFKYVGETDDGRKIYRTNYKEGTPKSVKQNDLIDIIQNIWSKKPIRLSIKENGVYKEISANFNPELSERSDLSKIVFGNRKGNGSEKRMTLDLSTDLYQIASDAKQTGSKAETGKDNKAHDGVKHWYYFITNLVYEDVNGEHIDCYMNIDVKENQSGHYFYSFAIEKGTAPQTLLAVVSDEMSPTVPTDTIISQDEPGVNSHSMQNAAENAQEVKKSMPGTRLSELVEKYGAISTGENPHRDVQVPKKTAKNKKVSQTVRTILEAKATPDEAIPTIEKMVEDGVFSYDVYTDKQAIANEEAYLKKHGWVTSLNEWIKDVNQGVVSKQHTVMGWALYNNAVNTAANTTSENERKTATQTAITVLEAMVRHQRSAAQALQATRILKKLSPETQLYAVQKSVSAFQKELIDKYGKKAPELKINEELAEQFINAKTPEERAEIEIEIYKDIGRQMPSRFADKWNAWRYLAMLGNLRTHVRNVVGNLGFAPVVAVKDLTATAIESAVYRVSGKKTVRGKALITGSKADRSLLKAAWSDYSTVADMISNGGKYSDFAMANQHIEEGRQIFKFKPLEVARKGSSALLEKEDMWFARPHYAYALAQYCKANNITAEQIKRGKAIAPARDYAIKEAQKATYRDTNTFSQMVSEWGRKGNDDNVAKKAVSTVIEGILPFRKTPANILVRGVEYSPIGLLKGLTYDLRKVSKGELSASEAIDNISAGLTGTGLLALGVLLAAQGLVRGHGGEDKGEKEFEELMGHQAYSLELPDGQSITLDWLAPEALSFFVGVNIWEVTKGSDEETNLSKILQAVSNISEPMLEMSCLQGLNDLFENIGYASSNDTSGLVSAISGAVTSYLTQGLPTLLGQAERTGEEYRMTTYTEKNAFLTGDMQYTLGKASNKIPFWEYSQIPYIDAWGRKEASGVALKRGLNNFLNPAYTSTIETSKMEKELLRLYEKTGEGGVFPSRADKYFTVNGKRKDLTSEQYVRYATLKGEKSYKAVSNLVSSDAYKQLSDTEKAKAVTEAYDYANQKAKEAISNYKPDTWVNKADEFGSNVGSYLSFRANVSDTREDNGGKISKQEVVDIILDMAQNDSDMWKMYLSEYESKSDMYAYDNGIDGETYMRFLEILDEVDMPNKTGKYGTYTQDEARKAVNQLEGLSRQEKAALWQSVNTTWKRNPF